jgi:hypothetical protein
MSRKWLSVLAAALALGGCSTVVPQQFHATEVSRQESRPVTAPARKQARRPQQPRDAVVMDDLTTTGSSALQQTPVIGSSDRERAQAENDRREQRIKEIMRICASC